MVATPPGDLIDVGGIMRYITIRLGDEDFELLSMAKGDRTWQEYIMKDVLNQRRRQMMQTIIKNEEPRSRKSACAL